MKKIQKLLEAISLDIKPGDVILTGRFKNKRKIVKSIGTDKYGQPTINGKSILKFKIEKKMPKKQWSAKSREELKESRDLRKLIRKLILERSQAFEDFQEWWFNTEEDRQEFDEWDHLEFTKHKDMLHKTLYDGAGPTQNSKKRERILQRKPEQVETLFDQKRDVKRYWNEHCDREFWQSGKVKYFHSLSYYGDAGSDLQLGIEDEYDMQDMSIFKFFRMYDMSDNKDEMSTFGIYENQLPHAESTNALQFGVLLEGRVTFAHAEDAFVESRSKGLPSDHKKHQSSGMPKRITPTSKLVDGILFDEEDVKEKGVGECILDNWNVVGIVVCSGIRQKIVDRYKAAADHFNLPLITGKDWII